MTAEKIFVGRKAELEQFKKVLENPQGQAVLVIGQAGMGKTWLVNKMAKLAEKHPQLKCGCVRYEVTPTDSVDSTMALMMDNAFESASIKEKSHDITTKRLEQWRGLLNVVNIGDLAMSLRRDPQRHTREQFLKRLHLISKRMPDNGRAIFIIDPEKYMQEKSDQSWAIVVKDLPKKIKFVFAQRPEDGIVKGNAFKGLENVVSVPDGRLGILGDEDVDDLLRFRAGDVGQSERLLRDAVERYEGHPYAIQAALNIIEETRNLEDLPQDPTPTTVAGAQWQRICESGDDAIKLFEAYGILEVGVPDEVVLKVSGLNVTMRKRLQKDSYLRGLLREEGYGRRIYHAILADHVIEQIGEAEKRAYHRRAVDAYHVKIKEAREKQSPPDALAATRLAEHVLMAEGRHAFVQAFVNECFSVLRQQGFLDAAISLSERALGYVERGSKWEAAVIGNLGVIYERRGALDKAETTRQKALRIDEKLESPKGMALRLGNLGQIYRMKGHLHKAEQMHKRSLEIAEDLGIHELITHNYIDLSIIYILLGELDRAHDMSQRALEMAESTQLQEVMASAYGNIAAIHIKKGELDKAEDMSRKSLSIAEGLGMQEVIANGYANLGQVYKERGNLRTAQEYWQKSLKTFEKIGMPHMIKKVQGWIDKLDEDNDS